MQSLMASAVSWPTSYLAGSFLKMTTLPLTMRTSSRLIIVFPMIVIFPNLIGFMFALAFQKLGVV